MRKFLLILSICLLGLSNSIYSVSNDSTTIHYEKAFDKIVSMLNEIEQPNFKKAVFITENAFFDDSLDYDYYNKQIQLLTVLAKEVALSDSILYNEKDKDIICTYGAVFKIITDTTYKLIDSLVLIHEPFAYDFEVQADSNQISWHLKGNGGILSNPSNLYKWYIALKENKIISKKSFEQLTFPHVKENESGDSQYAYGWTIMNSDKNTKIIAHNGSNGVFYADFIQLPEENAVIIYMTNELRYDTQIVAWEIEQLFFKEDYTPVVPKMKSIKHSSTDITDKQLKIIHRFVELILTDDGNIDDFINEHVATKERERRFKMWVQDMRKEFLGYQLKHILEYGDISYDIVLESKDGKVVDLTPCFDLQFNESNQIVAFGW